MSVCYNPDMTAPPPSTEEHHFTATDTVRDLVIGMADGLTVPFALAAGLAGANVSTAIVVTAGLAEIAAGSISMGLGGYLSAKTEMEHYAAERQREVLETVELPHKEREEVEEIFRGYGLTPEQAAPAVNAICADQARWVEFMMRFELGLAAPKPHRAKQSAFNIGTAYAIGGIIPLSPYMLMRTTAEAFWFSLVVTGLALLLFGYVKGRVTGASALRGALQTLGIGGAAAAVAFGVARLVS